MRRRARKTQSQVAKEARISRQTLDAIENNRVENPELGTLKAIVAACKAELGDLFVEVSPAHEALEAELVRINSEDAETLRKCREILAHTEDTILRVVIDQVHKGIFRKLKPRNFSL